MKQYLIKLCIVFLLGSLISCKHVNIFDLPFQENAIDKSSNRTTISGKVYYKCKMMDKPAAGIKVSLFAGNKEKPLDETTTEWDGRFFIRSPYLYNDDFVGFLKVLNIKCRLPADPDYHFIGKFALPCPGEE